MKNASSWRLACLILACTLMLPLNAIAASQPELQVGQQASIAIPLDAAVLSGGLFMQAHAQILRPAPLPDPDITAPGPGSATSSAQADPSLAPGFFSPSPHFAGDGYASGSSIENNQNHRHSTGGGMNLSIPMP